MLTISTLKFGIPYFATFPSHPKSVQLLHILRRGGPALKRSQVYPLRYGRKFQELHCKWVVPRLAIIKAMMA